MSTLEPGQSAPSDSYSVTRERVRQVENSAASPSPPAAPRAAECARVVFPTVPSLTSLREEAGLALALAWGLACNGGLGPHLLDASVEEVDRAMNGVYGTRRGALMAVRYYRCAAGASAQSYALFAHACRAWARDARIQAAIVTEEEMMREVALATRNTEARP